MKAVKLKDGSVGCVIREFNCVENPYLTVYKKSSNKERLYEDFIEVELNGEIKEGKCKYLVQPKDSKYSHIHMIVCKKDVVFIDLMK